jgi:glycosyltransferase involved in cell wall biosynthesis
MNGQPLVSIIIPCFNYGQFVHEAVESALNQSHPTCEVLVVDDGSTDDSVQILQTFGSRIQLIQQQNAGVVAARNRGWRASHGDFVMFLDADDLLPPAFVAQLLMALNADPSVAFSYGDTQFFGHEAALVRGCPWNVRKLLYRNYVFPSALMRRRALEKVGGFTAQTHLSFSFEDWDLWLTLAEAGFKGVYVPGVALQYRYHGAGRNAQGLHRRALLESELANRHPKLYARWDHALYLTLFRTLSRMRNIILRAPGT